jgi:hypothetical protein
VQPGVAYKRVMAPNPTYTLVVIFGGEYFFLRHQRLMLGAGDAWRGKAHETNWYRSQVGPKVLLPREERY